MYKTDRIYQYEVNIDDDKLKVKLFITKPFPSDMESNVKKLLNEALDEVLKKEEEIIKKYNIM